MGLLSSLLSLVMVVGAGYVTINYIIPKLNEGTLIGGVKGGSEGSSDEAGAVMGNIADAAGIPTNEGDVPPETPPTPSEPTKTKAEKPKGNKPKAEATKTKGGKTKGGKTKTAKKALLYAYLDGEF